MSRRPKQPSPSPSDAAGDGLAPACWVTFLAGGLIVLATLLAYQNSFGGPFILDDTLAIKENPTIRKLWPIWKTLCPPNGGETVTGRPLLNLSLAVNYAASGLEVRSYHAVNLAIHVLAALLLFGILRRTFLLVALGNSRILAPTSLLEKGTGSEPTVANTARNGGRKAPVPLFQQAATSLALIIALFWAIHPLQTESVTYTVQRAESLVGLFYLLTLYCFIRGAESGRGQFWYVGSVLACLMGMASKEVMVSAPLIVLLYDRTFLAGSFREAWRRRYGVYLALAGTWLLLAWLVIAAGNRGNSAGFGSGVKVGSWPYLCTQFWAIVHYLQLSVWPSPLLLDYGRDTLPITLEIVPYAMAVAFLGLATIVALWRWPKIGFLGAWFFAILAPTSSVVPVATQVMAEHRMYLPLAAVVAAVTLGGYVVGREFVRHGLLSRQVAGILDGSAAAAVALTLVILTFQRNADYQTTLSIWQDTVAKAPENARDYTSLGMAFEERGRFDDAIAQYRRALEIKPDLTDAYYDLGVALTAEGRLDEAAQQYRKVLEMDPRYLNAYNNLGEILRNQGKPAEAIAQFRQALAINPNGAGAENNLGIASAADGRPDEAIAHLRKALEIQPDYVAAYYNLGVTLASQGRLDEAVQQYRKALEIQPDFAQAEANLRSALAEQGQIAEAIERCRNALKTDPDDVATANNLAWLLATCPVASLRSGAEAVEIAGRAERLSRGNQPAVLDTLAAAYAEAGRFPEAIVTSRKALELAMQQNKGALTDTLRARIALYEAGKPFRQTLSASSTPQPRP